MSYELWDTGTRNLVATFEKEVQALRAAREWIAVNPTVYPDAFALVVEDDEGETALIAVGSELASKAATHS